MRSWWLPAVLLGLVAVPLGGNAAPSFTDPPGQSGSAPSNPHGRNDEPLPRGNGPSAHAVPEPGTLLLLGSGVSAAAAFWYVLKNRK